MEHRNIRLYDKDYQIKVEAYPYSKSLKVTLIEAKTKEKIEVTSEDIEYILDEFSPFYAMKKDGDREQELIEQLELMHILEDRGYGFVEFNANDFYQYDKQGLIDFITIDRDRRKNVEFKGKSIAEIKENIEKEVLKFLNSQYGKKILDYKDIENPKIMYSLVNKNNPQDSFSIISEKEGERVFTIRPYRKNEAAKIEEIPEFLFNYDEYLFDYLENGHDIINIDFELNYSIWCQVEDFSIDEIYHQKGMQKYLKYCKDKNITQERLNKELGLNGASDIMMYYKEKKNKDISKNKKERAR